MCVKHRVASNVLKMNVTFLGLESVELKTGRSPSFTSLPGEQLFHTKGF